MASGSDASLRAIGESTPVRLSLILATVGFIIGAVWWASALQTKVDAVLLAVQATATTNAKQDEYQRELEKRVLTLELKGKQP